MKKQMQLSPEQNTTNRVWQEKPAKASTLSDLNFYFDPARITRFLAIFVVALVAIHTISLLLFYQLPNRNVPRLMFHMFDLGQDSNFPTLFSSFMLLITAAVLYVLFRVAEARNERLQKGRWFLLSLIFLYLCIDEGAQIHDVISNTVSSRLPVDLPDFLWASWVIPYFVFAAAVGLYYLPFLRSLPAKTRNLTFVAGFMFVLGALGFEMLESPELANTNPDEFKQGIKSFKVHVMETFEEIFEMSGIVLFIYTLLDYLKKQDTTLRIKPLPADIA